MLNSSSGSLPPKSVSGDNTSPLFPLPESVNVFATYLQSSRAKDAENTIQKLTEALQRICNAPTWNFTHLAVSCAAQTASVLQHADFVRVIFRPPEAHYTNIYYSFITTPTETLKANSHYVLHQIKRAKVLRKGKVQNVPVRIQSCVHSSLPLPTLKVGKSDNFQDRLQDYCSLFANSGQQTANWFEPAVQQMLNWNCGEIDSADPLLPYHLACSLRNQLNNANALPNEGRCTIMISTKYIPVDSQPKMTAWILSSRNGMYRQEDESKHRAYIAFGSNLGDRLANIEKAATEMEHRGLKIRKFGHLYESCPMYHTDQPSFLNTVCEVYMCTLAKFYNIASDGSRLIQT